MKNESIKVTNESRKLHSMKEFAEFLGCSLPTAQRIKNSGKIPYCQIGRTIIFDTNEIIYALKHKVK